MVEVKPNYREPSIDIQELTIDHGNRPQDTSQK